MTEKEGAFRFTYFTKSLGFNLEHSWDRSEFDKGSLFKAGAGLIEVLLKTNDEEHKVAGLDYRIPQGVFMCIQVWNIDELFDQYRTKRIPFKQELTSQSWGHRSFSVMDPNDLILFFFEEQF